MENDWEQTAHDFASQLSQESRNANYLAQDNHMQRAIIIGYKDKIMILQTIVNDLVMDQEARIAQDTTPRAKIKSVIIIYPNITKLR